MHVTDVRFLSVRYELKCFVNGVEFIDLVSESKACKFVDLLVESSDYRRIS